MRAKSTAALALLALVLGCGHRDAGLEVAPRIVDRARLGNELLFVDANHSEVDALDVTTADPTPSVARIHVSANPKFAIERKGWASFPGSSGGAGGGGQTAWRDPLGLGEPEGSGIPAEEVLVLSDGSRDGSGEYIDKPTLAAIHVDHTVRNYELSAAYSQMRLSEDARFAILWGQQSSGSEDLLSNPNRVALVDLEAEPGATNPYERTLKAAGGNISDVLLTPPLAIAGQSRPVALFSFGNGLGIWDITNPTHEDITAEGLSVAGTFLLNRVVADAPNAKLYLVQQNLTDLRVLSFGVAEDPAATNDFRISLNQLPLALSGASDMVPYTEAGATNVLVAAGNRLAIVHTNDSRFGQVVMTATAERLFSFEGRSPNDNDTKQRVLAWGAGRTAVSFVELNNLENAGTKNVEQLPLGYTLSNLVPLPNNLMLAVLSGGGIGTIDLNSRRFKPLSATIALSSPLIESDAHRIWVGGNGSDSRVGYFEPATLATGSLRLDDIVQEMFLFETGSERRVVVAHNNPIGSVTIVDAEKATRASSRALVGFLVDGLVNR